MGGTGHSVGFLKSFFWVLYLLVFLLVSSTMIVTTRHEESLKPTGELMRGREKGAGVLNMSKRKVYNGPDPIHNRRAGNSRQPPGRA